MFGVSKYVVLAVMQTQFQEYSQQSCHDSIDVYYLLYHIMVDMLIVIKNVTS